VRLPSCRKKADYSGKSETDTIQTLVIIKEIQQCPI